jgi:thymidylate kinase
MKRKLHVRAAGTRCIVPRNCHPFISIEGLSGSGKTTIAKSVARLIGAKYYRTPSLIFASIRRLVDAKASPLARHLYYYAAIAQASDDIALILKTKPVVCDKYFSTVVAYSRAFGVKVNVPPIYNIRLPDYTFLLIVPERLRHQRIARRGKVTSKHAAFLRMEIDLNVMKHFERLDLTAINNAAEGASKACDMILDCIIQKYHLLRNNPVQNKAE